MRNFKELKIWQKDLQIAINSFMITETFPSNERFGLTSQINRQAYPFLQILQREAAEAAKKNTIIMLRSL
jgi:hypothetical protein